MYMWDAHIDKVLFLVYVSIASLISRTLAGEPKMGRRKDFFFSPICVKNS